jgi:predicted alpha/beta-fold hydrolase
MNLGQPKLTIGQIFPPFLLIHATDDGIVLNHG